MTHSPTSGQAAEKTASVAATSPSNTASATAGAVPQRSLFPILGAVFVAVFLLSNITATKGVTIGPLVTDAAFFLFPLAYVIGDVLTECYGFVNTRRIVFTGFGVALLAVATFAIAIWLPPADFYPHQDAFSTVLGLVPRIVVASLAGYLVGQLLNAYTLAWMKNRSGERRLWARLLGSTIVGELADTIIFCAIAAGVIGINNFADALNYTVVGFLWKTAMEVLVMPITYAVVAWVKRHDDTAWSNHPR